MVCLYEFVAGSWAHGVYVCMGVCVSMCVRVSLEFYGVVVGYAAG